MPDENQIPLTPQEREERIKNLMMIMKTGGKIPEEIFVGLTAEQKVQLEEHQNKFNLCIERILEKKEGILGKLNERERKSVMPKVIEDLLSQMPNTSEDIERVVYKSLKKRGLEYFEQRGRQQASSCQMERPGAWYSQIDLHGFAHSLISDDDSMRRLHDFFPDDEIMIRTQIADKIINEIISKDSKTEQDARQLGREIISDAREQYSHLTELKPDMPAVESVDTRRAWYNNPSQEALLRTVRNLILSGGPYTSPVSEDTSIHEQIASSARSILKQYPPKSEDEYRKIVRTTAERFLQPFIATVEPQSQTAPLSDTKKEEEPVARKYLNRKTITRAAIGGLGALLLAGAAWLFTRESGLEERVSETKIAAIEEIKTPYVEKTILPENTTVQKPIDEAVKEDYGADILPAEVKLEPVISVQDDKKIVLDEDKPLPDVYVPAVPKETRKEISKETFEAMYVLAKTKVQEKISNYAELWNQFFQHAQTPVQIIPAISAETQEQIPQVHEPRRVHAKKTAKTNAAQYLITPYLGEKFALQAEKNLGHCPVFGIYVADAHKKTSAYGGIEYSQTKDAVSDPEFNVELESSQFTGKIGIKHNLVDEKNFRVSAGLAAKLIYERNLTNAQVEGTSTSSTSSETLFGAEGAIDICYSLGNNWDLFVEGALGKNFGDANTGLEGAVRVGFIKKY